MSNQQLEDNLRKRFFALPIAVQEREADEFFILVNALRLSRFGNACGLCEDCGFLFPIDDLSLVTFRSGNRLPVCLKCQEFEVWAKTLFGRVA